MAERLSSFQRLLYRLYVTKGKDDPKFNGVLPMINADLLDLTADIVATHVANNSVSTGDVATLIKNVHGALKGLGQPEVVIAEELKPAVSVRSSVKPDYIVCLEDGKKLKMLKRHLSTHYQLTPAEYRRKWGLPDDYPMVAPNYAQQRKDLALKIGLGRKPGTTTKAKKLSIAMPKSGN